MQINTDRLATLVGALLAIVVTLHDHWNVSPQTHDILTGLISLLFLVQGWLINKTKLPMAKVVPLIPLALFLGGCVSGATPLSQILPSGECDGKMNLTVAGFGAQSLSMDCQKFHIQQVQPTVFPSSLPQK
jgi:hypothetical protein